MEVDRVPLASGHGSVIHPPQPQRRGEPTAGRKEGANGSPISQHIPPRDLAWGAATKRWRLPVMSCIPDRYQCWVSLASSVGVNVATRSETQRRVVGAFSGNRIPRHQTGGRSRGPQASGAHCRRRWRPLHLWCWSFSTFGEGKRDSMLFCGVEPLFVQSCDEKATARAVCHHSIYGFAIIKQAQRG